MQRSLLLLFSCLALLFVNSLSNADSSERPNILFVITDDESCLERGVYGWSGLKTPAFDRVAKQGVLFTNTHASAPSCAPSRATVLTGRNFWELQEGAIIQAWLPKKFPLMPNLLEKVGYHVGSTGKGWGPGVYPEQAHGPDSAGKVYNQIMAEKRKVDYFANMVQFLDEKQSNEPFFFWLGFKEPHSPWDEDNYLKLEKEFGVSLDEVKLHPSHTEADRKVRANFLYEILDADRTLGKVLDLLEDRGLLENTLVIYTSDNGTALGTGRGKSTPYLWGTHEPMAVSWPAKVPTGRTITDYINFADFAPTILEAAGVKVPGSMTGKSFLKMLTSNQEGRVESDRSFIVTGLEWHGEFDPERKTFRAIRNDKYSLIFRYNNDESTSDGSPSQPSSVELYDLTQDPWEEKNLASDPVYQQKLNSLSDQLIEFGRQTDDPRMTGELDLFREIRQYVQERKRNGYKKS
ncbi:Heparan N-sulfatase [Planctomycetales bacterium 10988]|nr:Heparan N-sulfatase [Planctomycetales bacterium 10988]